MRCVAVIEADRFDLDTVILWDKDGQLVAFAYKDGTVKMTRPLAATSFDDGVNEVRDNFQIATGQITRVTDWVDTLARTEPIASAPARWGLDR